MNRSQEGPSRREDSAHIARAKQILSGEAATVEALLDLAENLKNEKAFGFARKVLARARTFPVEEPEMRVRLTHEHALCTYKDPDLPLDSRLDRALEILQQCDSLNVTKDQETLGLAGSIFKRKWQVDGRKENLERSLSYYLRGYEQGPGKGFGYTAINAAYVLDLLAHLENEEAKRAGAESRAAEERHNQALTIRKRLVEVLTTLPEDSDDEGSRNKWRFYTTLAEACFGLERYGDASAWIEKGRRIGNIPAWEFESTATQLASLARLRGDVDITAAEFPGTEAARVLENLLGENKGGVRTAYLGKVGLALSGGGFRASLFHIGVLARLAELDMLRHVEVLSCVSGGSILGAHYYLEIRKLLNEKNEEEITCQDYIDVVKRLQVEFLAGVQKNVRSRILSEFTTNLKMVFLPGYSRTLRAGDLFESLIYRRVKDGHEREPRWLTDLFITPKGEEKDFAPKKDNWRRRAKVPDLILNATSLNSGHNWQFTASWMGEPPGSINTEIDGSYRLRRMYFWEAPKKHRWIRLGHAVAASACVPGLFEPLPFKDLYPGKTVRLVDGGIHDNQGIVGLLEQDCKVLLVSDASGQMDNKDDPSCGLLGVPMRSNSILQSRIRESQYEDLQSGRRGGLLRGLMFVHLKKDLDVDPVDWLECENPFEASDDARPAARRGPLTRYGIRKDLQRSLAAIRTDLDSFNDAEAYALMASGYRMTEYEFAQSIKGFPNTNAKTEKWAFLQIEDAMRVPEQARQLKKVLDAASQRAFKVWRLSAPLKIVAAILGVVAAFGMAWSVWTFYSTSLLTVGVLGLAVGAMVLTVLFGKGMLKVVNLSSAIAKVGAGIVLSIAGPLLLRPHLWILDRMYLRMGKVKRFKKEPSVPSQNLSKPPEGSATD